jgi:uncharacterized protein (DUF1501 family)
VITVAALKPVMTRRQFLISSGVVAGTALAAGATGCTVSHLVKAGARTPLPVGNKILVLITLYGGNDGLNTLIPYTDGTYYTARPDLAYRQDEVLPLADGLGLNPAMTGLKALYDAQQLAVVRGVGYPSPDRSHFRSMAIWQTAAPESPQSTGWLGRWLDAAGADPLLAVNVGPVLPPLLAGQRCAGAALPTSGALALPGGVLGSGLHALDTPTAGAPSLQQHVAQSGSDLLRVVDTFASALGHPATPSVVAPSSTRTTTPTPSPITTTPSTPAPTNELAAQLDIIATCIAANAPTRAYSAQLGGFDTHADEKATQSRLLGELDAAVSHFLATVQQGPHGNDVVVVLYSEFGRRVAANASDGTDHGTASNVFVLGRPVRGGMYGDQPSLTDLDQGDLKFNVDFRSVYATLLHAVLDADPQQILGGSFPTLAFV